MFNKVSQEDFLTRYWQQKSLVFRNGFDAAVGITDGDELAGLACEDAVESRIICGSDIHGPWTCQQGPFTDFDYTSLGTTNWTLLVQGADQWDDDIRALMNLFDFLPKWRLEDVMASFAPTGGGVGPHFDYYDVFLIQAAGRRRWQTGLLCDDQTPLQDNRQVKLLQEFNCVDSHDLEAGDAIYIPAGTAHWGTSLSDDCVTLSVGFRAPSDREIVTEAIDLLATKLLDSRRYEDMPGSIDQDSFKINALASAYAESAIDRLDESVVKAALAEAFGRLVTDTRYCSYTEDSTVWTVASVAHLNADGNDLSVVHQVHCRMAYTDTHLFVNGVAYEVDSEFAKGLCHGLLKAPLKGSELAVVVALLNDDMIVFE